MSLVKGEGFMSSDKVCERCNGTGVIYINGKPHSCACH